LANTTRITRISIQGEGPVLACPVPVAFQGLLDDGLGTITPISGIGCLDSLADAEDPSNIQDAIELTVSDVFSSSVDWTK